MRTHHLARTAVAVALLAAMLALLLPGRVSAAPRHHRAPHFDRGLTIAATPDPITAGEGVLIYGQLKGPANAHRRIWLFHRINPADRFTPVSVTRTDGSGFYEFVRADGVVVSNRNWFVLGPHGTHSRTIHELVSSVLTLNASESTATTAQTLQFTGTVFPTHRYQRVLLQQQNSIAGNGWQTIASGYTDGSSAFSIMHRFKSAGSYTLRAYFPNDPRNTPGQSPSIEVTIQQQQNPSFTIDGSAAIVTNGQAETISGTLYAPGSTTVPQPGVSVTLYGRQWTGDFKALASTTTSTSGGYSFTQMPLHNMVYRVQASGPGHQTTANLYVGVQDVVTATLATPSLAVGDSVKITGTVTPDHTGHAIYLQEQNAAGNWVDVESGYLTAGSTYTFVYTPGQVGNLQLRVQITGGPVNVGGVSSALALTVNGAAPVGTLPPAQ